MSSIPLSFVYMTTIYFNKYSLKGINLLRNCHTTPQIVRVIQ